jgi:hypothetical protein
MKDLTLGTEDKARLKEISESIGVGLDVLSEFFNNENFELDDLEDRFNEYYKGSHIDLSYWAEQFLDDTDFFNMSNHCDFSMSESEKQAVDRHMQAIKSYFNYKAYGRDCQLSGDIYSIDGDDGYIHVFTTN